MLINIREIKSLQHCVLYILVWIEYIYVFITYSAFYLFTFAKYIYIYIYYSEINP